jgi:FAD dependent oxidoreductase
MNLGQVLRWGSRAACLLLVAMPQESKAIEARPGSQTAIACDILIVGGGLAGTAAAYEALYAGRTVCMTELTDWVGGQISSQGTSAMDETTVQRSQRLFPKGYLEFRDAIFDRIKQKSPGNCWVSAACFLPSMGNDILREMLVRAQKQGKGKLLFFPNTVVKSLQISPQSTDAKILAVKAIQHQAQPNTAPLNSDFLSQGWDDFYSEADSPRLAKTVLTFTAPASGQWMVIEATETGELLALADLPYRVGVDPRTYKEPSSSSKTAYPYCPQAFTYTFAMESTAQPEPTAPPPPFYKQYEPFYSYDGDRYAKDPALVFTYRRIWSTDRQPNQYSVINPGDISMQNWGGGNDYGPGTATDNLLYTRQQLSEQGQLTPNGWKGGLRVSSLKGGEELAQGYFYWLVAGATDSKLGSNAKKPWPNLRYLKGLASPMGTAHGLQNFRTCVKVVA